MNSKGNAVSPRNRTQCAVVVAHPDDETLWAGGTILMHSDWRWFIACLSRGSDADRAPRFSRALQALHARGRMGDLDDDPDQKPLGDGAIQEAILSTLPKKAYDIVITHGLKGEYTRHRRHEETSLAVADLWRKGKISARELWMFAYEDGGKQVLPHAIEKAHLVRHLPDAAWRAKYRIITSTYGFREDSFEARTTPKTEAFWCFDSPEAVTQSMDSEGEEK